MTGGDPSATSSLALLEQARSGDAYALNRLLQRYLPRLTRWASGRLQRWARDLSDTDDLVQDTLVRSVANLPRFQPQGDGALPAYLRTAVMNRIRDEIRRRVREPEAAPLDTAITGVASRRSNKPLVENCSTSTTARSTNWPSRSVRS